MNHPRYYVQLQNEGAARGPLPAAAVRRLVDAGDLAGPDAVCREGDAEWLTLDDYWEEIMPPAPTPRAAAHPAPAVHPALVREPLPVWRIVVGVVFLLGAVSCAWWLIILLPAVLAGLANAAAFFAFALAGLVVNAAVGVRLTTRK